MVSVMLCGCGEEIIPELTDEQQTIITDYSALLLLKYDKQSPNRLMPAGAVTYIDFVDPGTGEGTQIIPQPDEYDIDVNSDPAYSADSTVYNDVLTGDVSSGGGGSADGAVTYAEGFDSFLGGESISINYAGSFEVVDAYPDGDEANPFLSVEASAGNKLLVTHFTVTNTAGDATDVNMGRLGLRYRVSVNGGSNKFIMTTLLPNDLMSYVGQLGAGESVDLVAVSEVSESESGSISSLDFTIKGSDNSAVIKLL